jgi:glycosidase
MDVFGTMEDVEELIKGIHQRQMRIILDLVMNHTSEYVILFFLKIK